MVRSYFRRLLTSRASFIRDVTRGAQRSTCARGPTWPVSIFRRTHFFVFFVLATVALLRLGERRLGEEQRVALHHTRLFF